MARWMLSLALAAGLAVTWSFEALAKVRVDNGALIVGGKRFKKSQGYRDAVELPDGSVYAVRDSGRVVEAQGETVDAGVLVRVDPKSGAEKVVFEGRASEYQEQTLADLQGVAASPDGSLLYVYGGAPGGGALWSLKPTGAGARFLQRVSATPGVVQRGPWKGFVMTMQRLNYEEGGGWFPIVLIDPSSGDVAAVCRKPHAGKTSSEAESVPYVPLDALELDPDAPRYKE